MEHTPTPWENRGYYVVANGMHVAECLPRQKPQVKECEANAAFIVRAVNSHEELIGALKFTNAVLSQNKVFPDDLLLIKNELLKALAKAEAK